MADTTIDRGEYNFRASTVMGAVTRRSWQS
jgi:ABC-type phosphate/phosphonate transport system permease subunit